MTYAPSALACGFLHFTPVPWQFGLRWCHANCLFGSDCAQAHSASLDSGIVDDLRQDRIKFVRQSIKLAIAVRREYCARGAIGHACGAILVFRYIQTQRSLNAGGYARFQHAHSIIIAKHHEYGVPGNLDSMRRRAAACAGLGYQSHLVGVDGVFQARQQLIEGVFRTHGLRSGVGHSAVGISKAGDG